MKTPQSPKPVSKAVSAWAEHAREYISQTDGEELSNNESEFRAWLERELARIKTCENCGERFIAPQLRTNFCSKACYHTHYARTVRRAK